MASTPESANLAAINQFPLCVSIGLKSSKEAVLQIRRTLVYQFQGSPQGGDEDSKSSLSADRYRGSPPI